MSEKIDYAARVQRGIALMDEKWPDWATEIDLEKLDIEDGARCMTAQYARRQSGATGHESFATGQRSLGLDDLDYELHGFNADGQSTGVAPDEDGYDTLNGLWKAEIERRRAQS